MATNESLDLARLRSELEKSDADWQMAYTSMTALTEDQREIRLGVPMTPGMDAAQIAEQEKHAPAVDDQADAAEGVGAPTSFDLRNVGGVNYTTPVGDQGNCGSCVAFGVAATMEGVAKFTAQAPNLPITVSTAQLFYCYGRRAGARCSTGWWPEQALTAARDQGVTFADYYPYTAGDQDCTGLNPNWPNHMTKVTGWGFSGGAANIKTQISTYGSVTACMDVYQDFFSYRTGVYRHVTGSLAGGHCICLIGYDDAQGCWIGKNSWGTGWGESGFFRIAYGQCRIESYGQPGGAGPIGVFGTKFRTWWPNQVIAGLWSNQDDSNVWAFGSTRGWVKLDGTVLSTAHSMLFETGAAKASNRSVGLFEHEGQVHEIYVW